MSRSIGRRKSDKIRLLVGVALGAFLAAYAIHTVSCGGDHITAGNPPVDAQLTGSASAPAPVLNATPAPSPTPTPKTVVAEPDPQTYEITFENQAGWDFLNSTGVPQDVYAYTTSFDDQVTALAVKNSVVANGTHWADTFRAQCVQLDITQEKTVVGGRGGRPLAKGAAFFDILGRSFNPSYEGDRITTCRNRCSLFHDVEDLRVISDWADVVQDEHVSAAAVACFKTQRRTVIHRQLNDCGQFRDVGEQFFETRQVEIPCPCQSFSQLVLTADPVLPPEGESFFNYHVFRTNGAEDVIPGNTDDSQVFSQALTANQSVAISEPADGANYYAFYDGVITNRVRATATCPVVDVAAVVIPVPSLRFECGCR